MQPEEKYVSEVVSMGDRGYNLRANLTVYDETIGFRTPICVAEYPLSSAKLHVALRSQQITYTRIVEFLFGRVGLKLVRPWLNDGVPVLDHQTGQLHRFVDPEGLPNCTEVKLEIKKKLVRDEMPHNTRVIPGGVRLTCICKYGAVGRRAFNKSLELDGSCTLWADRACLDPS
jgi:hypothetical protein